MASPDTVHVSLSLEESPSAAVHPDDCPGTLSSTHGLDNVFDEMVTSGFDNGEGEVTFDFEPLHYCLVLLLPQEKKAGLTPLRRRVLTLHYRTCLL